MIIGIRVLQGVVVEKASAEEQYEEAIMDGNAAIMLGLKMPEEIPDKRPRKREVFVYHGPVFVEK